MSLLAEIIYRLETKLFINAINVQDGLDNHHF